MTTSSSGNQGVRVFSRFPAETRRLLLKALALRPFGIRDSESLMRFAPHGSLICACARNFAENTADRREVCRMCGGLPQPVQQAVLDRPGSPAEIRAHVEFLRLAGVRARGHEIPDTVSSVHELHSYLDEFGRKRGRKPPRKPNAPATLGRQSVAATGSRVA